jgi:hypothetical protein
MRRILAAALACGVLVAGTGRPHAQESGLHPAVVVPKGAEEAWQLEGKRRAALIAGDLDTLEALCSDALTYTHTTGMVDTKKRYMKALRSGVRYEQMDFLEVTLSPYDNTVVMVGLAQIAVKSPSGPIRFKARFTGVWAKQQGQWRFAAWQTTRVPEK